MQVSVCRRIFMWSHSSYNNKPHVTQFRVLMHQCCSAQQYWRLSTYGTQENQAQSSFIAGFGIEIALKVWSTDRENVRG
jgi:hypothetical protein